MTYPAVGLTVNGVDLPRDLFPRCRGDGAPQRRRGAVLWTLWRRGGLFRFELATGRLALVGVVGTRATLGSLYCGLDSASAVARAMEVEGGTPGRRGAPGRASRLPCLSLTSEEKDSAWIETDCGPGDCDYYHGKPPGGLNETEASV